MQLVSEQCIQHLPEKVGEVATGGLVSFWILLVVTVIIYLNMPTSKTKMTLAIKGQTQHIGYTKAWETEKTVSKPNHFKMTMQHKISARHNASQTSSPTAAREYTVSQNLLGNNQSDSPTASSQESRCSQNGTCSVNNVKGVHEQASPKTFAITWYHIPYWTRSYSGILNISFDSCEYSNCEITMDRENAANSDAVIFDGRMLKQGDFFTRPSGQIWIFAADEAPRTYHMNGGHFSREPWVSSFNWTMVYDRSNTDIHYPYGEIIRKPSALNIDYKAIFERKNKTALIVNSNCNNTMSERVKYVSLLAKHVDLDSLGDCGTKPFNCGKRYVPGKCFGIVNDYKFYLAFENAFCDQYFTEKVFNNFNYNSILVVRGGRNNDSSLIFPAGTYISTSDFNSVKDLADYMNKVAGSETLYTKMLKRKNEYYSVPRKTLYQRALCNLCEKMNKQDTYKKTIFNINEWATGRNPCEQPSDLKEFN